MVDRLVQLQNLFVGIILQLFNLSFDTLDFLTQFFLPLG